MNNPTKPDLSPVPSIPSVPQLLTLLAKIRPYFKDIKITEEGGVVLTFDNGPKHVHIKFGEGQAKATLNQAAKPQPEQLRRLGDGTKFHSVSTGNQITLEFQHTTDGLDAALPIIQDHLTQED